MTEQKGADPTKVATVIQEIVAILVNEDSETRQLAVQAAMMCLRERPIARLHSESDPMPTSSNGDGIFDLGDFFHRDEKLKPSDHAYLCAAYHFSVHGSAAFSLDDLRAIAREAGVVLPDRLDMTLKQAAKGGKRLFQAAGREAYKPTAAAGLFFRETWDVRPGKKLKEATIAGE